MRSKVKIATTWLRSCSGCHMKIFDLHERFLNLQPKDCFTRIDRTGSVDIGIIEGAVANKENEQVLKEFRAKSRILVAVGTCACFGAGMQSMLGECNQNSKHYQSRPFYSQARPLHQVVTVDYCVPGCPPPLQTLQETITNLLEGRKPNLKTSQNLCDECMRKKNDSLSRSSSALSSFYTAIQTQTLDPEVCFLEQGVLCKGNITIGGCGARCLRGNIPCWGCMGPFDGDSNQKSLSKQPPGAFSPGIAAQMVNWESSAATARENENGQQPEG